MKHIILSIKSLLLIFLIIPFSQTNAQSLESFNDYKLSYFVDNFNLSSQNDFNLFPHELKLYYYNRIFDNSTKMCKKNAVKTIIQEIDTVNRKRSIIIVTSKAGDGYLQINKGLNKYIEDNKIVLGSIKILFYLNNTPALSQNEITKLVKLRKNRTKNINYKREGACLEIRILTK